MGEGFVKLYSSILDSSVWGYSAETRLVWITLLAMADASGRVHAAVPGIANRARVSIEATQEALRIFQEPDEFSRSDANEGRRIEQDGRDWVILNFKEHRERQVEEAERARKRKWWRENRGKKNPNTSELDPSLANTSESLDATRPIQKQIPEADTEADAKGEKEEDLLCPAGHDETQITDLNDHKKQQAIKTLTDNLDQHGPKHTRKAPGGYSADFERFWLAYPNHRRKAKQTAFKAFERASKNGMPSLDTVIGALEAQKRSYDWTKNNGEYIPLPATWLNGHRWEDAIDDSHRPLPPQSGQRLTAQEQAYLRSKEVIRQIREEADNE